MALVRATCERGVLALSHVETKIYSIFGITMRAWPVARSIFDAPLGERSERADDKLDNIRQNAQRAARQARQRLAILAGFRAARLTDLPATTP